VKAYPLESYFALSHLQAITHTQHANQEENLHSWLLSHSSDLLEIALMTTSESEMKFRKITACSYFSANQYVMY